MNNYTFGQLLIGDMFNTAISRWVKVSESTAIVVMSGILPIGYTQWFPKDTEIILLYSSVLSTEIIKEIK